MNNNLVCVKILADNSYLDFTLSRHPLLTPTKKETQTRWSSNRNRRSVCLRRRSAFLENIVCDLDL